MFSRFLPGLLTVLLAGTVAALARADIYTWVDAAGNINLSNLAPPASAHVINVVHASPQPAAAREAVRQAEVQALEDRVRQLESEADLARQPAPVPQYRPAPVSPVIQYVVTSAPALPPYAAAASPSPGYCDATQLECGLWAFPGVYPASVIVFPATRFRSSHPNRRGHPLSVRQPMHVGAVFRSR